MIEGIVKLLIKLFGKDTSNRHYVRIANPDGSNIAESGKVKVSSNDTTTGWLNGKLLGAAGRATFTEGSDGGNETLTLDVLANVTNEAQIAKSIGTTKGDIIGFTASATPSRLAVGTNDYVLTAASGEATGIKWAAAAGGTHYEYTHICLQGNAYVATAIIGFLSHFAGVLVGAKAYAVTAPTVSDLIIDADINGTSMFSTTLQIDAGANADDGNVVINTAADDVAVGDRVTFDITQIGTVAGGAPLYITLKWQVTA